ncbi:F0F1 ATP synthase subunit delta [Blastococcus sp. Marseille-P5729]|uniref:F0F1 ATP synthase subunit delta n=1 Tax=Blastococcus sp. Marseille-P5729 TaxID=2086582 RepID=UPI000D0EFF51|nr:F0F1 ATP synthase subunit delta [Blastococcus sp. Marseille-P5729]
MLPALMQATSRESLAGLREQLEQTAGGLQAAEAHALSSDLRAIVRVLAGEPALRRALADPSASETSRAELVGRLFAGQVGEPALGLTVTAAKSQWSTGGDVADALSDLSHQAAFIGAEKDGSFSSVEEDLFRFGRVLDANGELEQTLSDASAPLEKRQQLLGSLIDGKVNPLAGDLLHGILANPRAQSMHNSVQGLVEDAAGRRRRSVAIVKSPVALTDQQEQRLTAALSRIYGREISVSVDVDESVLGGLRVQVGDDVIDGSVAGRLDDIQRRFAG